MMIEISGLTRRYEGTTVLDVPALTLEGPSLVGLLGRNGAGKTTLFYLLTNRIFPTSGGFSVDGVGHRRPGAMQSSHLACAEDFFPRRAEAWQLAELTAAFYPDFDEDFFHAQLAAFGLADDLSLLQASTGQATLLKALLTLATNAPHTYLDEPMLGLDGAARRLFYRTLIESYSARPRLIVLSTHILDEAATLFERVLVLKAGRLIVDAAPEALLASARQLSGPLDVLRPFVAKTMCLQREALGQQGSCLCPQIGDGPLPAGVRAEVPTLETLYLALTAEDAGDERGWL